MTLNEVGGSLPTSVSGHITSFPLFVSQLSIMLQKTDFFSFSPYGCDDSFEQVPSTSCELVDNRRPTEECTGSSQQSANSSQQRQ